MTHQIFIKRDVNKKIQYVTCLTCNTSYPSAELMLKEHINIDIEKVPEPGKNHVE